MAIFKPTYTLPTLQGLKKKKPEGNVETTILPPEQPITPPPEEKTGEQSFQDFRTPEQVQSDLEQFARERAQLAAVKGGFGAADVAIQKGYLLPSQMTPEAVTRRQLEEQARIDAEKARIETGNLNIQSEELQKRLTNRSIPLFPIGNFNAITPEGAVSQAITGVSIGAGAFGGAKLGAAGGSAIAPGIGTAVGAIGGAIAGGAIAGFSKIGYKKRQDVKEAYSVFLKSTGNIDYIINSANQGAPESEVLAAWDEEMANISAAERGLKQLTDTDVERLLSGGMDERRKIEAYKRRLPFLRQQLLKAIIKPNPNAIIYNTAASIEEA